MSNVIDRNVILPVLSNWDYEYELEHDPIIISNKDSIRKIKNNNSSNRYDIERTKDGIHSPRYGVDIKETEDSVSVYRCQEGCTTGDTYDGVICPECHTKVRVREGLITTVGWINIQGKHKLLTPFAWGLLKTFFKANFNKIIELDMAVCVDIDGQLRQPAIDQHSKFYGIGYWQFQDHYRMILDFYYKKLYEKSVKVNDHVLYGILIDMYERGHLFTNHVQVITPLLREAVVIDSNKIPNLVKDKKTGLFVNDEKPTLQIEELNGVYSRMVANSLEYNKSLKETPKSSFVYDVFKTMQDTLCEITPYTFKNGVVGGKEGVINSAIHGGQMNFSGRGVITPMDRPSDSDEVEMPWRMFLTLHKYELLRTLRIVEQKVNNYACSLFEAHKKWKQAFEYGSNDLIELAIERFRNDSHDKTFYALLQRPPSLNNGSIQLMRITTISRDLNQKSLRIPYQPQPMFSGDYDGDAYQVYIPKTPYSIDIFKKIGSKRLSIDRITGHFEVGQAPQAGLKVLVALYSDPDSVENYKE